MASIYERLRSWVIPRTMVDLGLDYTPQYDFYEDGTQNEQSFPQLTEELEPMPKSGDYYIRSEVFLPIEDQMTTGHVVVRI